MAPDLIDIYKLQRDFSTAPPGVREVVADSFEEAADVGFVPEPKKVVQRRAFPAGSKASASPRTPASSPQSVSSIFGYVSGLCWFWYTRIYALIDRGVSCGRALSSLGHTFVCSFGRIPWLRYQGHLFLSLRRLRAILKKHRSTGVLGLATRGAVLWCTGA